MTCILRPVLYISLFYKKMALEKQWPPQASSYIVYFRKCVLYICAIKNCRLELLKNLGFFWYYVILIQNSQDKLFHSVGLTKEIEFIRYQTLDLYIVSDLN